MRGVYCIYIELSQVQKLIVLKKFFAKLKETSLPSVVQEVNGLFINLLSRSLNILLPHIMAHS